MNASTHLDWSKYHAKAFGMRTDHEAEMTATWAVAFERAGYSVAELFAATNWMLTESAPRFREQHLDMIQKRIASQRSNAHRESVLAAQRGDEQSRCIHCDNVGLVVVPHPAFYVDGRWSTPWPTAAVTCLCMKGEKSKRDAEDRKAPMMTLAAYEVSHHDWQEQMTERENTRAAMQEARQHTRYVDGSLGSVLGDVIKKQAAKRAA